jgi:hypothetical protein
MLPTVNDAFTAALADKICERLTGLCFAAQEADLRLRLALEQRVTGASAISFGLDRLSTTDAAAYLGLQAETLRATAKRKALDLPTPYIYGIGGAANLTLGWSSRGGPPRQQSAALRAAGRLQQIPPSVTGRSAECSGT